MINFSLRTSFAGVPVTKKVERASMAICKKYKTMRCTYTTDKSVAFEMDDAEFKRMQDEHADANLDYLIEIEGIDYQRAW
jgi:hypothetical protein